MSKRTGVILGITCAAVVVSVGAVVWYNEKHWYDRHFFENTGGGQLGG